MEGSCPQQERPIEAAISRVQVLQSRVEESVSQLAILGDKLFGAEPPAISGGEKDEPCGGLGQLELGLNRLTSAVSHLELVQNRLTSGL